MDASPVPSSFTASSKRLHTLAQQPLQAAAFLRRRRGSARRGICGQGCLPVGIAESATPIARNPDIFRPKRAAVLICLFEGDAGELRVILTKRSSRLSTHSGEVALPGGKSEPTNKDDAETATREAKEEIGLDPSLVNVVTIMEPLLSKHLLREMPVIGILTDKNASKACPNPAEVDAVFDAPLEMFIKDDDEKRRRAEEREWMGVKYLVHFFDYETENDNRPVNSG